MCLDPVDHLLQAVTYSVVAGSEHGRFLAIQQAQSVEERKGRLSWALKNLGSLQSAVWSDRNDPMSVPRDSIAFDEGASRHPGAEAVMFILNTGRGKDLRIGPSAFLRDEDMRSTTLAVRL